MTVPRLFAFALLSLGFAGPGTAVIAQTVAPYDPTSVRRLTPAEKERILASSDERAADAALSAALGGGTRDDTPARQIHGELGVEVGTGGTAGIFGTALIPLGDRGTAILSFEDFRTDVPQYRRGRGARLDR